MCKSALPPDASASLPTPHLQPVKPSRLHREAVIVKNTCSAGCALPGAGDTRRGQAVLMTDIGLHASCKSWFYWLLSCRRLCPEWSTEMR